MLAAYLWGVATPIFLAYVAFGSYIMVGLWSEHPSEHWRSQYRSPYTKPPLTVRSWAVFLTLWLPTPLLWPLTLTVGRLLYWRYRRAHNAAAARQRCMTQLQTP